MFGAVQHPPPQSARTMVETISLSDIACQETNVIVQAWKKWRGWHAMPPYRSWLDAKLGPFLAHSSVARVIDGGLDYEFEYIGGAHVRAYGVNHQGKRVSDIVQMSPRFGKQLKASYDLVRISGRPHAFHGTIGSDTAPSRFAWFETVYLPFSENGMVSHILNAAMYQLRADGV